VNNVLLAANISASFKQKLEEELYHIIDYSSNDNVEKSTIVGIITSNKLTLNAKELQQYTALKWIARMGSGMEIIDTNYCDSNNIKYYSSPNGIANSVAEHIVGMLVALQKNIATTQLEINNKQWIREPNRGDELYTKTFGIIGFGHTGKATAEKLFPFCKKIIAYDKYKTNFSTEKVTEVTLETLQQEADIITIHLPLTDETIHFFNDQFMQQCKPHTLINTSRGEIVNTTDLLHNLEKNKITGACLDVLEHENELQDKESEVWKTVEKLQLYNVIITPHIAGYSHHAIEKMSEELSKQLFVS
jgi:D-3-phosphoglycerate dehydrogenase